MDTSVAEDRRSFLGATDVAALACPEHPWSSPFTVQAEKLALVEAQAPTAPMVRGTLAEPFVAMMVEQAFGLTLVPTERVVHHSKPYLAATPDRGIMGRNEYAEIKTHNGFMARFYGSTGSDLAPEWEVAQAIWQAHIGRVDAVTIYAYFGGDDLRDFNIPYDPEVGEWMEEIATEFWQKHIVEKLPCEPGAKKSDLRMLARLYGKETGETILATPEIEPVVEKLLRARIDKKQAESRELDAEIEIKAYMQGAAHLQSSWGRIDWVERAGSISYKRACESVGLAPDVLETFRGNPSRTFTPRLKEIVP